MSWKAFLLLLLLYVFLFAPQVVAIDFQALTLAFTTCLLPPLKQLNWHQIEPVSTVPTFILLSFMAFMGALVQVVNMLYLSSQPWFQLDRSDSPHNVCPLLTHATCCRIR